MADYTPPWREVFQYRAHILSQLKDKWGKKTFLARILKDQLSLAEEATWDERDKVVHAILDEGEGVGFSSFGDMRRTGFELMLERNGLPLEHDPIMHRWYVAGRSHDPLEEFDLTGDELYFLTWSQEYTKVLEQVGNKDPEVEHLEKAEDVVPYLMSKYPRSQTVKSARKC